MKDDITTLHQNAELHEILKRQLSKQIPLQIDAPESSVEAQRRNFDFSEFPDIHGAMPVGRGCHVLPFSVTLHVEYCYSDPDNDNEEVQIGPYAFRFEGDIIVSYEGNEEWEIAKIDVKTQSNDLPRTPSDDEIDAIVDNYVDEGN
jgi:hypothetical protein